MAAPLKIASHKKGDRTDGKRQREWRKKILFVAVGEKEI